MRENKKSPDREASDDLFLEDLQPTIATCGLADPGPDPTWDPDPFPMDDDDGPSEDFDDTSG